jgi:cobalamin biosynthesis protein CobD/CbiB
MRRKREVITPSTPATRADYVAAAIFWALVLGWPLFVVVYRWLH